MQPHILIDHLASYFKLPDQLLVLFFWFSYKQNPAGTGEWTYVQDQALKPRLTTGLRPSTIHNEEVQIVDSYKYLGTLFDSQLISKENTESWLSNGVNMESTLR